MSFLSACLRLFMHVLCVAGIHDGYSVAIDGVGEIPLVGVRHVVVAPTGKGGFTSQKSMVWHTYLKHVKKRKKSSRCGAGRLFVFGIKFFGFFRQDACGTLEKM